MTRLKSLNFDDPAWYVAPESVAIGHRESVVRDPVGHSGVGDVLVLGEGQVNLSTAVSYSLEEVVDHDAGGLLVAAGLLFNLAAFLLVAVMAFGWRENFLIAVVLMMFLGAASLVELRKPARSQYQKLTVYGDSAAPVEFACANRRHMAELVVMLEERGIGRV